MARAWNWGFGRFGGLMAAAGLAVAAGGAQAQSMNPYAIADTVMGQVCVPFAETGDRAAAVAAAEALGYGVEPRARPAGEPFASPSGVTLWRGHHGTVSLMRRAGFAACSVGVIEALPGSLARGAEAHFRALGMTPVLDEREGATALIVWRGRGRQAVILRSGHFGAGSELIVTFDPPPAD